MADAEYTEYFAARVVALRRVAFALCGDWHTAEDLTQHTFVQLYRHWGRVRGETVDAYTRRVLVNAYLNLRRDRRREQITADPPDRPWEPPDDLDGDVLQLLDRLPKRQRALIVLRHLEDLSVADTARALGITEGAVKSQTSRGLQALRALMVGQP